MTVAHNEIESLEALVDPEGFPVSSERLFRDEKILSEEVVKEEEEGEDERIFSSSGRTDRDQQKLSIIHSNRRRYNVYRNSVRERVFVAGNRVDLHYDKYKFKNFIPPTVRKRFVRRGPIDSIYPWLHSFNNSDLVHDFCWDADGRPRRTSFRISDHTHTCPLTNSKARKRRTAKKKQICMNIDIWEEFYYGVSILDKRNNMPSLTTLSSFLYKFMRGFIPVKLIEFLVITAFFVIFFMSCLMYNMFWQLMGFFFLEKHLSLHEAADERNIKIKFTGSVFQGPGYAYIRQVWCAHCAQQSTQKITTKLMKNYRTEIEQKNLKK